MPSTGSLTTFLAVKAKEAGTGRSKADTADMPTPHALDTHISTGVTKSGSETSYQIDVASATNVHLIDIMGVTQQEHCTSHTALHRVTVMSKGGVALCSSKHICQRSLKMPCTLSQGEQQYHTRSSNARASEPTANSAATTTELLDDIIILPGQSCLVSLLALKRSFSLR